MSTGNIIDQKETSYIMVRETNKINSKRTKLTSFGWSTSAEGIGCTLTGLTFWVRLPRTFPLSKSLGSGGTKEFLPTKEHWVLQNKA